MRAAICLRGKCLDKNLDAKTGIMRNVNYKNGFNSIKKNIVDANKNWKIDFIMHGWVENIDDVEKIEDDYKPVKCILEKQRVFFDHYKNIKNWNEIFCERYKLITPNRKTFPDMNFNGYFESIHSYAYSISTSMNLCHDYCVEKKIKYDIIISVRYDVTIDKPIILNDFVGKNLVYVDNVAGHGLSPLFAGDSFIMSTHENMMKFRNMFTTLKHNVFNSGELAKFQKYYFENRHKYPGGRLDNGRYTNHTIFMWTFYTQGIKFDKFRELVGFISLYR